jgi:cell wall-associated NlpC family hydrolase
VLPEIADFGLVKMNGDSGRLIRFGQWLNGDGFADFEHAFIYVGDDQIIEAEPKGAKLSSVHEYKNIVWSTGWFDVTDVQRRDIAHTALSLAGTPYSFADYAAIAAHTLHVPGNGLLKSYVSSSKHLICSQLVDYCYRQSGADLFPGRWPGYVTPASLYDLRPKGA